MAKKYSKLSNKLKLLISIPRTDLAEILQLGSSDFLKDSRTLYIRNLLSMTYMKLLIQNYKNNNITFSFLKQYIDLRNFIYKAIKCKLVTMINIHIIKRSSKILSIKRPQARWSVYLLEVANSSWTRLIDYQVKQRVIGKACGQGKTVHICRYYWTN